MALFSAAFWYQTSFEPFPHYIIFLYEISTQSAKFIVQYNRC